VRAVLVVEDDDAVRGLIRLVLARGAFAVREAADGDAALALARAGGVDLVLPGCSGLAVCRALAADPATAGVPVVLLTGLADEALCRLGLAAGAVAYLTKPFSPAALLAAVRRYLSA
jgi:DNA-binding response OmpR family regulator